MNRYAFGTLIVVAWIVGTVMGGLILTIGKDPAEKPDWKGFAAIGGIFVLYVWLIFPVANLLSYFFTGKPL